VAETIPENKARNFNLAVIDHAHSICLPKNPRCAICPLNDVCNYVKSEAQKLKIRELQAGMEDVNVAGHVTKINNVKEIETRFGEFSCGGSS